MRNMMIIFLLLSMVISYGQAPDMNNKIISASFDPAYKLQPEKRKILTFKKKSARYNPLNYLAAGLMYFYQNLVSEQIQATCTYETSCSEYTKLSIQKFGFVTGVLKGFNQLSECYPAAIYEHPRAFINGNKIINSFDNEVK